MKSEQYAAWLKGKIESKPIIDYVSRCERVEKALRINLDDEYEKDEGKSLLLNLAYSQEDQRNGVVPSCKIHFGKGVNLYAGLSSLRTSIRKYFDFYSTTPK